MAASPFVHYDIGAPSLTDLWVDPAAGNDGNSGATRDQALRTLAEAWNRVPQGAPLAATGYRIQLAPGRYSEASMPTWWDGRHGTFEHPVIVQAADGAGTVTLAGIDVHDVDYLYLMGLRFEVQGGGGNVAHFASCDHVLIRDCELAGLGDIASSNAPQESLKVNQSQYVFVEDSDISGASWTALDYVAVQYGHVIGSKIHRAGDWGMYFKGGSSYLRVEGNEIYDATTGGFSAGQGTGFEYMVAPWLHYETYDVKFVNNVVHDTEGAGIGVNGSYNVLMAYNTMYRVGQTSHAIEIVHGHRSCDGNTAACAANLAAGGWGTATPGQDEPIPNQNVFIYNNIVYNPPGYQSRWQQFAIDEPSTPSAGSNIPSPARADNNVQIRGNIVWNGPADLPLGVEDRNLLVTEAQLRADNAINTLRPELVDPAHGDFRPVAGGNVFSAATYLPPEFEWSGLPARPIVPAGTLGNAVPNDRAGAVRPASSAPGAYAVGAGGPKSVFFLHQSVGEGIMADHNGHPGLVAQIEAAGHSFDGYSLWESPPGGSSPPEIASLFADQNGDGHYGDLLDQRVLHGAAPDVLMLKSCFYTLAELETPANLGNWEQAFIHSVAPYANQHPQQKLVVMPAVPERKSSGLSAGAAARARDWSEWLASDFIADHTTQGNVYSFNLFNCLADPESDRTNANYQREAYLNGDPGDSHPNDRAYSAAADAIANFVLTRVIAAGINHAPVAAAQSVATPKDASVAIPLAATDADGDSLTYELVDGPGSGAVELTDNVATYRPRDGWHGSDRFTFRAYDGEAYSNAATVSIAVYDPNPVVALPAGTGNGNALVRRHAGHLQVINQRGGRLLFDQPLGQVASLTVAGADNRADTLTIDWPAGAGGAVSGGVVFHGGEGLGDALILRGTIGRDSLTAASDSAAINGLTLRFGGVERLALHGGAGNDTYRVSGLGVTTTITDTRGTDLLDFSGATVGVTVDLGRSSGQPQRTFAPSTAWTLTLSGTIENAIGSPQADVLRGSALANRLEGRGGNDALYGGAGNDVLFGGAGDDWLYGQAGADRLDGGAGNNVLLGGVGNDLLNSGPDGRNLLIGGAGSDTLQGGSGEAILIGGTTAYDSRAAALALVMREWISDGSAADRRAALSRGVTDPAVGLVQLKRRTNAYRRGTVVDDGLRDTFSPNAASDWVFGFAKDLTRLST